MDTPICLDAPCMLGCPHIFGWPLVCLDAPMFGYPLYVRMPTCMFGCPHMFGHPPVGLDAPICLDTPYVWLPHMFGHPHIFGCTPCMFGCPNVWITPCKFGHPYVWMPPVCLDTPICLIAPMYVWKMFGCLLYIYNKKKACFVRLGVSICHNTFGCPLYINNTNKVCFVRLRGCPYVPIHLECPCMFGHLPFLDVPLTFGYPIHLGASKHTGDSQIYGGHPNIQGVSKHVGYLTIQQRGVQMGAPKHTGGI